MALVTLRFTTQGDDEAYVNVVSDNNDNTVSHFLVHNALLSGASLLVLVYDDNGDEIHRSSFEQGDGLFMVPGDAGAALRFRRRINKGDPASNFSIGLSEG